MLQLLFRLQESGQTAAQSDAPGIFWTLIIPLGGMFLLMYFTMIRPQKRQMQQRDEMLRNLKKHDRVMTSGGLIGVVERVSDSEVVLMVDERRDVYIRVAKPYITAVLKPAGGAAENGSPK
jgi:preprotein translocase subunit YajC